MTSGNVEDWMLERPLTLDRLPPGTGPLALALAAILLLGCQETEVAPARPTPDASAGNDSRPPNTGDASPKTTKTPPPLPGPFNGWTECETLSADAPNAPPYVLNASADGRWLAVLDAPAEANQPRPTVRLWHLPDTTLARRLTSLNIASMNLDIDLSPDGAQLAIGGDGGKVVSTADGHALWAIPPPDAVPLGPTWIRTFAFSPDGSLLASAGLRGLELFRPIDGTRLANVPDVDLGSGLAFSPDGKYLASSSGEVRRLNDGGPPVWSHPEPSFFDPIASSLVDNWAVFSPDGAQLLLQNTAGTNHPEGFTWVTSTHLVSAATGKMLRDLGPGLPRRPVFSPDGRWLAGGDRVMSLADHNVLSLGQPAVMSVFLPDGRIATVGTDAVVRLYCPQ